MESLMLAMRNICAFVLLTTVINNLLNTSSYRKYIRFFVGLVMIILVSEPLFSLIFGGDGIDGKIMDYFENEIIQYDIDEFGENSGVINEMAGNDIIKVYEKKLYVQLLSIIENEGYKIIEIVFDIEHDFNSQNYGNINSINITLEKDEAVTWKKEERLKKKIAESLVIDRESIFVDYR